MVHTSVEPGTEGDGKTDGYVGLAVHGALDHIVFFDNEGDLQATMTLQVKIESADLFTKMTSLQRIDSLPVCDQFRLAEPICRRNTWSPRYNSSTEKD